MLLEFLFFCNKRTCTYKLIIIEYIFSMDLKITFYNDLLLLDTYT